MNRNDIKDFFIIVIMPFVLVAVIVIAIGESLNKMACNNYQEMTGKQTKYLFMDECYIETDNGFRRYDEYIARSTASEGLGK